MGGCGELWVVVLGGGSAWVAGSGRRAAGGGLDGAAAGGRLVWVEGVLHRATVVDVGHAGGAMAAPGWRAGSGVGGRGWVQSDLVLGPLSE